MITIKDIRYHVHSVLICTHQVLYTPYIYIYLIFFREYFPPKLHDNVLLANFISCSFVCQIFLCFITFSLTKVGTNLQFMIILLFANWNTGVHNNYYYFCINKFLKMAINYTLKFTLVLTIDSYSL